MTTKNLQLFGRDYVISGSEDDGYFAALPGGADITDSVLNGLRPFVPESSICIDVGANIGLYALALSALAPSGRVCAFEPSPRAFEYLRTNVEANKAGNVEIYPQALGAGEETIPFHDFSFFTAGSFSVNDQTFLTSEMLGSTYIDAPCRTLDDFCDERCLDRLDLMKIDVEGAEISVLEGSTRTLEALQPLVVLEFNSFAFTIHQDLLPQKALSWLQKAFPYLYVMDRADGSLSRLRAGQETYNFLYDNGINGPTDNLLGSFEDLGVDTGYVRLGSKAPEPIPTGPEPAPTEDPSSRAGCGIVKRVLKRAAGAIRL